MISAEPRILILTPTGRDSAASAEVMRRSGMQPEICAHLSELLVKLEIYPAAVLLAEEALFQQDLSSVYAWVDRQPAWSDLPFVVLTTGSSHPSVALWRQKVVTSLRNVSLLERPVQSITLTSALQSASRARQRQYEVRALIESQQHAAEDLERLVQARTQQLEDANQELQTQIVERARIEASLRQVQKIEALGQLTGGVAHDFNNLLMVIMGGLDMLERRSDPAQRRELMDGMKQAAQRGAALTRQLLTFSRSRTLNPQSVNLIRHVGAMRELLDRSLGGDVHVQLEFAEDPWAVEVDPGELELVVLNLAVNARDAMPAGGIIRIVFENRGMLDADGLCGDYVRLSVIDSGTGMTPEVKERVFEPFFTTKELGKGSGLGLAQVYGFATQSRGAIHIDTEVGRGTCVSILLPRSFNEAAGGHTQDSLASPLHSTQSNLDANVLLVEDNDEVAALATEMLRELGYEVFRASSALEALSLLAEDRSVDIVFSDIMMPGEMNGVELAQRIRATASSPPVLLTSGYAGAAKEIAETEGFTVLPKPYRMDELAIALTRVVTGRNATATSAGNSSRAVSSFTRSNSAH